MIAQLKKIKSRKELIETISDKLRDKGMPRHCGVCKHLDICSRSNPEDICRWLKASKHILSRFKLAVAISFLLIFVRFSYAAAPTLGTVAPSSGTGTAGVAKVFTATYSDPDGWQNLATVNLVFNTAPNGGYCFSAYYNQNTNKLYLWNDAGTAVMGGYAPGSSYIIENSFARLVCSQTTVSGTGTTMTVKWSVVLKSSFTGLKNIYLLATDDTGVNTGIVQKGTWNMPNIIPAVGTVVPSSGTGQIDTTQIFTATYSDANGWQNLWNVNLLVNTVSSDRTNCAFAAYNRVTNQLYLFNDAWTTAIGGYTPGANYIIENSYARLDCSKTTVSGSGNNITVKWALSFKPSFIGQKNTYLRSIDYANSATDFIQKGAWKINAMPGFVSVVPSSGNGPMGVMQVFRAVYSDPDGWQNLSALNFLVNTIPDGTNCLSAYYDQNANKLYIRNDAKTAWVGGFVPGSANMIENSYVKLDCSKTIVSGAGNNLTIDWTVAFKSTFTGLKNIFLQASDDTGAVFGLVQMGTWTIQSDTVAPIVNITEPEWGAIITND